ncbi:hypothetical protein IKF87_01490 [Candidatus Saccharibacteria bacterium]|nr:hypothetical protein [Candidatus Saccharibacteria bacterium]
MKTDLASSIGAAIAGVLIAYFICNLFIGPIEDFTVKTVDSSVGAELVEPDPEVFNYKALNPTVEVYVGDDTAEEPQQNTPVEPEAEPEEESSNTEEETQENTETETQEGENGNTD